VISSGHPIRTKTFVIDNFNPTIIAVCRAKEAESAPVKYWEIIADNLNKAGWSLGYVSAVDSQGRTIWNADARSDDGKRFVVRADEKLTAFLELERGHPRLIPLPKCRIIRQDSARVDISLHNTCFPRCNA